MTDKDEEANEELLEQLKVFDELSERPTLRERFSNVWKSLKLRAALGHIGLMVSLSIYCVVGGFVSSAKKKNTLLLFCLFSRNIHSLGIKMRIRENKQWVCDGVGRRMEMREKQTAKIDWSSSLTRQRQVSEPASKRETAKM